MPVLATDVGGNAELVLDGETGDLVPPGDVQAMAEGLLRMAAEPGRAAAMGRAGRVRVEQQFSLPAMVAGYRNLYLRLLAQRTSSSKRS